MSAFSFSQKLFCLHSGAQLCLLFFCSVCLIAFNKPASDVQRSYRAGFVVVFSGFKFYATGYAGTGRGISGVSFRIKP